MLKEAVIDWLNKLGYSLEDENFVETPDRVVRAWKELMAPKEEVYNSVHKILGKRFPSSYEGVILVSPVNVVSVCPHHLLPVLYEIDFAYLPTKYVVGISKIPRFLRQMGRLLMLQEDFTKEVVKVFEEHVQSGGCFIQIRGLHSCMFARGVQEDAMVRTIFVSGKFRESLELREEVLHSLSLRSKGIGC